MAEDRNRGMSNSFDDMDDDAPRSRRRGAGGQQRRRQFQNASERPVQRRVCTFCVEKVEFIDYKKSEQLITYLSGSGKLNPRRRTGACAKHQRWLAVAIKRARYLALLPHTAEHIRNSGMRVE